MSFSRHLLVWHSYAGYTQPPMPLPCEPSRSSESELRERRVRLEVAFEQMMSQVPASAELPTLGEIGALGAASAELWSAVADLLNLLDRELGSDGSGLMKAQISAAAARAVLEEGSAARPPCGWQSCLAAGYAKMNDCASALDARSSGSVPMIKLSVEPLESLLLKPKEASWACWQDLLHLWTKTAGLSGRHALERRPCGPLADAAPVL